MANHKSAEKRARQSVRRQTINTRTKGALRKSERRLRASLEEKASLEVTLPLFRELESLIGKAAQKGRIPMARASRKISRLAKQIARTSA